MSDQSPPNKKEAMNLFKSNPLRKLQKEYEKKVLEVRDTQRAGDIQKLSTLSEESEELLKKIEALKRQS
jgi:hypothetical protein